LASAEQRLKELGIEELPKYLPAAIQEAWSAAAEPAAAADRGRISVFQSSRLSSGPGC